MDGIELIDAAGHWIQHEQPVRLGTCCWRAPEEFRPGLEAAGDDEGEQKACAAKVTMTFRRAGCTGSRGRERQ